MLGATITKNKERNKSEVNLIRDCWVCNNQEGDISMHLFETKDGDRWVCAYCRKEQRQMLESEEWEYIFDKDDPVLRCSICGHPDFEVED